MTYTKPEVAVLGQAISVMEQRIKGHVGTIESVHWRITPAYDLDE